MVKPAAFRACLRKRSSCSYSGSQALGTTNAGVYNRHMDAHWSTIGPDTAAATAAPPDIPGNPPRQERLCPRDHILAAISTRLTELGVSPGDDARPCRHPMRLAELLRIHRLIVVCDHAGRNLKLHYKLPTAAIPRS